jgi:hypothetical protein
VQTDTVRYANRSAPGRGEAYIAARWMHGEIAARSRLLNEFGDIELSKMPKESPVTGPMKTQPVEPASNVPTPVLPMMPTGKKLKKAPQPKQNPKTRAEAVRIAKAKITRRNSLRKQREALRG